MGAHASAPYWLHDLEVRAPDVVAVWRVLDETRMGRAAARRELRRRVTTGSAHRILAEQEAVADAMERALAQIPEEALRAPGGEEDWNVAQAFAHATAARRFLVAWAALAAAGNWPAADAPRATPGVPGPADASRETLTSLLDKSRRSMRLSAAQIAGHETEPCALMGTPIGKLRCGEWLLWVGVHDLMHLEQIEAAARRAMTA
jgi:DinB superfamily